MSEEYEDVETDAIEPLELENETEATVTSDGSFYGNLKYFWLSVLRAELPAKVVVTAEDYEKAGCLAPLAAWLDNSFRVSDRGSTFYFEFTGGMTTFFSMCYIMILNGVIIGGSWPVGTGISKKGVFFATTVSAGIFTFIMGLFVNVPVALAPGMGP